MSMRHTEVSPLTMELSAYIADALEKPLPPAVVVTACKSHSGA